MYLHTILQPLLSLRNLSTRCLLTTSKTQHMTRKRARLLSYRANTYLRTKPALLATTTSSNLQSPPT